MTPEEDEAIVERINRSGADLVWVGLSTPKQERWMAAHVGRLDAKALLGVGAAFDIHAGLLAQAPAWMQRSGLEWLYRLGREPGASGGGTFATTHGSSSRSSAGRRSSSERLISMRNPTRS